MLFSAFQSFAVASFDAVATNFPLGAKLTLLTEVECTSKVTASMLASMYHTFATLSECVTRDFPSAEKETFTLPDCPTNVVINLPVFVSHILVVLSSEPVARYPPLGSNDMLFIALKCPTNVSSSVPLFMSHIFVVL